MSAVERPLRIGELARLADTTPRTVRYYEEIGLLAQTGDRQAGAHRTYGEADVERLREILRLKSLLGLSLEELRRVVSAEDERMRRRREYRSTDDPVRRRELLIQAQAHVERMLELVRRRKDELLEFEAELNERRERVRSTQP
jgi:MerR family transcriptional regulator, repressor of the yfmOP operon